MKKVIIIACLFIFLLSKLNAQTYKKLEGKWFMCNDDSAYYKNDTISFYNSNLHYKCNLSICWNIQGRIIKRIVDVPNHKISGFLYPEKVILKKENGVRLLLIMRRDEIVESFQVIDFKSKPLRKKKKWGEHMKLVRIQP